MVAVFFPKGHDINNADMFDEMMLREQFDDMLDDIYPTYSISGLTMYPSQILKGDSIAYEQAFSEYVGDYSGADIPWDEFIRVTDDDEWSATSREFIIANPQRIVDGSDLA